ncbi:cupin domain-containing protein [Arenivirga flava]|uniref:Cupin type-2 domain-containing protein n=1 Tax=Arenivirga flava TaxID=1930060 RepID=A0AA37UIP6_9MICO|nr:cupin domain-containing protein [Arenivirga flava]GMA27897.1 hypothetical protein GCM10025874_11500 [Arenivirga flava]
MSGLPFPGGTSVTRLRVYELGPAADGLDGGTPHLHTVSSEAYVVLGGAGAVQLLDRSGYREQPLAAGDVVWFGPGTVHRAVNHGGLDLLVILSNRGLPEHGDAVMTFPDAVLADPEAYASAAAPGEEPPRARRDLGVEGFLALRDALLAGDGAPYERMLDRATALVHPLAGSFAQQRMASVGADEALGSAALRALAAASSDGLGALAPRASRLEGSAYGMCGVLQRLDGD